MSEQPQDEAGRYRNGPERMKLGPEDVPEVEGHVRYQGPESVAFGTEGAADAERHAIRPEDDPDPADGRRPL